jgi:hypothetical protein
MEEWEEDEVISAASAEEAEDVRGAVVDHAAAEDRNLVDCGHCVDDVGRYAHCFSR